jgi:hypothetical protein
LEFVVPIQIDLDTSFYVFLDYGTVISTLVTPNPVTPNVAEPGLDAGGIQGINITMDPPSPGSCHTITFFAALKDVDPLFSLDPVSPASLTYTSALCSVLTWTYDPTGAGNCPTIDAGGISDADIRRPEAEASTPRDALADLLFMLDVRGQ